MYFLFPFFLVWLLLLCPTSLSLNSEARGRWQYLQKSIGISAMHMQLLSNDKVVMFDRTDYGLSNISLPDGRCRNNPNDTALTVDCTAHSVEYDVVLNKIRPLFVQTDVWCSSGSVNNDGALVQTGGFNDGIRKVRVIKPCNGCDWDEIEDGLAAQRWYATNHILPDGRQIIVGGRRQFNYEFYPKKSATEGAYYLRFLALTNTPYVENNLYPFVHLNVDGNLFIFANNKAILLDYGKNMVVRTYPDIPGGDPRNYPSTGSSVLLPLKNLQSAAIEAEVLVCGGAPTGSFLQAKNGTYVKALATCGRIKITDPNSKWVMETMPMSRVMGDMVLLPNGNVLIINGGGAGTAGWEYGREPVLAPVLYRPDNPRTRFEVEEATTIPRMYHSTALLLRDGRVLVAGSNPHRKYEFSNVLFPTELSLEAFSPRYLDSIKSDFRPKILSGTSPWEVKYGQKMRIEFRVTAGVIESSLMVTMVSPAFVTHSYSMNQRVLVLGSGLKVRKVSEGTYGIEVTWPGSTILAPAGYYLVFVVHEEIPSEGIWVHIK